MIRGNEMYNILICDDDHDIVSALKIYLSAEGYGVLEAYNGREALEVIGANNVDLVLMDIMMPVMDGVTATARIRERSNVPVILLTAKSEDSDKVLGLNVGADDYITKPFSPIEVIARVRSHLRRYTQLGGTKDGGSAVVIGGIELNDSEKVVTLDGETVSLTPIEYSILKLMMSQPGKVFSSKEIYEKVWNTSYSGADGTVAVHIRHLREKLELDPAEPRYIKVVWGQGYKIESK